MNKIYHLRQYLKEVLLKKSVNYQKPSIKRRVFPLINISPLIQRESNCSQKLRNTVNQKPSIQRRVFLSINISHLIQRELNCSQKLKNSIIIEPHRNYYGVAYWS